MTSKRMNAPAIRRQPTRQAKTAAASAATEVKKAAATAAKKTVAKANTAKKRDTAATKSKAAVASKPKAAGVKKSTPKKKAKASPAKKASATKKKAAGGKKRESSITEMVGEGLVNIKDTAVELVNGVMGREATPAGGRGRSKSPMKASPGRKKGGK